MKAVSAPLTKSAAGLPKWLPWALGGAGLAALENHYIGENLPPELKHINLAIGAGTGGVAGAYPAHRAQALLSVPLKEMGLFGIGSMDRFRRSQQDLVDTNLQTARTNLATAHQNQNSAGARNLIATSFMIPALLGSGALAYYVWQKRKRDQANRYKTVGERGTLHGRQRIRIDIPHTAMPDEFYKALMTAEDNPRTRLQVQEQEPPLTLPEKAAAVVKWAAQQDTPGVGRLIGDFLMESTGVPSSYRALREGGLTAANLGSGNHSEALRYGVSGLGNAALGVAGLRLGLLPAMAALFGKPRLAGVMTRGGRGLKGLTNPRQLTEFPGFAKVLFNGTYRNRLDPAARAARRAAGLPTTGAMDRLRNRQYQYNPQRFAWRPSTTPVGLNRFLSAPAMPPRSFPGHVINTARFGVNRTADAAYRVGMLGRRNPNASLIALGTLPAGLGVMKDDQKLKQIEQANKSFAPTFSANKGPMGMPISGTLSMLMQGFGSGEPVAGQIRGRDMDPFSRMR